MNKATIGLQFLTLVGMFIWWILYLSVVVLWLINYQYNGAIAFCMVVMGYWTINVLSNIAHVTTCGVTAVWWFNKEMISNPTWKSYVFASTRGLGSICFGSLVIAIIQTLRGMARSAARRGGACACLCALFLTFLEWLARYFTSYTFVQVAVYGLSFMEAAKNTWQLFSTKGFDAIINDNLSNLVLACGAIVGGVITFLVGALLTFIMFNGYDDVVLYVILMAIVGFFVGYYFTLEFMFPVQSAIRAVFVCWAEDPAALKENHPICYKLLSTAWAKVHSHDYDGIPQNENLD